MKNNKLQVKEFLYIFNEVTAQGTKVDGKYQFMGLSAWHDFDGYTCFIGYKDLTLTLLFHGRYTFDYQDEETLNAFMKKTIRILSLGDSA
ncbi:DUF3081 family protein [Colwelliaceae bacterium 6471]